MTPFPSREKVIPDVDDAFAIRQKYMVGPTFKCRQPYAITMYILAQSNLLVELSIICCCFFSSVGAQGGGLVQWNLGLRTTDQGVPGSSPGRGAVRCCLEQVTFTPCLVLVKPRKQWTYNRLGQTVARLETMFCLMC